jgi:hypothetical protein
MTKWLKSPPHPELKKYHSANPFIRESLLFLKQAYIRSFLIWEIWTTVNMLLLMENRVLTRVLYNRNALLDNGYWRFLSPWPLAIY